MILIYICIKILDEVILEIVVLEELILLWSFIKFICKYDKNFIWISGINYREVRWRI